VVVTGWNPVVPSDLSSPGLGSSESVPSEASEPVMAVAAGLGSWAAASDTEKEALRRLQELLGTQEIATERQAQELQQLRAQVTKLRSDLASRERELLSEREAQIQTDTRLESLEIELAELRKVSREAQRELAQEKLTTSEMHQRIAQFQGENQALRARVHEMEPYVEALQQRDEELRSILAEQGVLREEVQRLNGIVSEERQRQLGVEQDRRAAERSHAAALAAATVELDTANVAREQLRQRLEALQAQMETMQTQHSDAAARSNLMSSQLEVERERARTLTNQLEATREQGETAGARYGAAMNELQGVRAQLELTRDESQALHAQLEELKQAYSSAKSAASATADERVMDLEQQLHDMEQDLADFAHAHENASQQLRDLRSELLAAEAARATMAERLAQQEEKHDRVVSRATSAEAQVEPLRSERDSARRALDDAENTIRTLRARQVALESEVRAMQDTSREVRSLRQQRSQLDQKLAETSGRLKTLELELAEPKPSDSEGFARVGSSPGRRRPRTDVHRMNGQHSAVPTNTVADEIAPATRSELALRRPTENDDEPVFRPLEAPTAMSSPSSVEMDDDLDAVLDGFDELDQEFDDNGTRLSTEVPSIAALPLATQEMLEEDIPTRASVPVLEPDPPVTDPRAVAPQIVEHLLGASQPIPAASAQDDVNNTTMIGRPLPSTGRGSGTYSGPQHIMVGLDRVVLDADELEEEDGVIDASDMTLEDEEPLLTFETEPDESPAAVVGSASLAPAPAVTSAPPPEPAGRAARHATISEYMSRAPRLGADALERRSTLGAREAFVIQNIDGSMSFADLLDVCGLPPQETQAILQTLYDRGIIDFDLER
jgi:predicted  nucleic acid-binding Zn-ribbon protein